MVNAPDGTGRKGAVPGIKVAGKTGTAQFWRNGKKDDHSWFLAFAPYDYPKIALAVMVEGGKSGGEVAAPIASEIIQKIFALDYGYDPGLKPLAPAIGNYDWVDSVDFKAGNATTKLVSRDKMSPGNVTYPRSVEVVDYVEGFFCLPLLPSNSLLCKQPVLAFVALFESRRTSRVADAAEA